MSDSEFTELVATRIDDTMQVPLIIKKEFMHDSKSLGAYLNLDGHNCFTIAGKRYRLNGD